MNQLHGERENYEKQLLTLVQQQEKILQEREGINGPNSTQHNLFANHMSSDARKRVFRVSDQVRRKPTCRVLALRRREIALSVKRKQRR